MENLSWGHFDIYKISNIEKLNKKNSGFGQFFRHVKKFLNFLDFVNQTTPDTIFFNTVTNVT